MEVKPKNERWAFLQGTILKESKAFSSKRELNFGFVAKAGGGLIALTVLILLCLPSPKPDQTSFHEKLESKEQSAGNATHTGSSSEDTWAQLQMGKVSGADLPSRGFTGMGERRSGGMNGGSTRNLNSAMILSRGGVDSKTQLPPGSRFAVRLTQKVTVASQGMPVIGVLSRDVEHESDIALPAGSKVFGDVSFDQDSERALFTWKSVVFPDGRQRDLSAIGVGGDGQVGIEGDVHSDGLKNVIGQALTTFIGAYADGSMTRNQVGVSSGGAENGLKNAVAETSKSQANALGESLKKERKWIELHTGAEMFAVLSAPFVFKDPGSVH